MSVCMYIGRYVCRYVSMYVYISHCKITACTLVSSDAKLLLVIMCSYMSQPTAFLYLGIRELPIMIWNRCRSRRFEQFLQLFTYCLSFWVSLQQHRYIFPPRESKYSPLLNKYRKTAIIHTACSWQVLPVCPAFLIPDIVLSRDFLGDCGCQR